MQTHHLIFRRSPLLQPDAFPMERVRGHSIPLRSRSAAGCSSIREDVFDFFRIHGFTPQEASKQMNWARKGRPSAKVIDPDGYQDFVRRYSACQYIPSKAWALEYYTALTKKHLFPAR